MQHSSPIYYVAVIFIAVLISHSEAKRGCALYGHSCYGGHGKRSAPPVDVAPLEISQNAKFPNDNKEVFYGLNQLNSNDNRWKSQNEYNFPLYNLVRQWMEDAKKYSDEVQQTPETETIFKNTYV